jgi:hypothetical protein
MVTNTRTYADFVLAANTMLSIDAIFYKNSANIAGNFYGVAYAFDYRAGLCVSAQVDLSAGSFTFVASDFPYAEKTIAIGDHFLVSQASALSGTF